MARIKGKRTIPVPVLLPAPKTASPDDAFCRMIARVANAPIRSANQDSSGAVHDDGLDAATLRGIARRWCARMIREGAFDIDELRGLDLALQDYTDDEFVGLIKGAVLTHLP